MMDDVLRALLIRGSEDISTLSADNAIGTATATAETKLRFFLTRIYVEYDEAVAAVKTVTLTYTKSGTAVSTVMHPDFTNGEFVLPMMLHGDPTTDVAVATQAGGANIASLTVISGFYG